MLLTIPLFLFALAVGLTVYALTPHRKPIEAEPSLPFACGFLWALTLAAVYFALFVPLD